MTSPARGASNPRARPCPACGKGRVRITPWPSVYSCDACQVGFGAPEGTPPRIGCLVPFCAASRGDRKNDPVTDRMEWICSRHWALVPRRLKNRRALLRRIGRRTTDAGRLERIARDGALLWQSCKSAAIEAAGGLR